MNTPADEEGEHDRVSLSSAACREILGAADPEALLRGLARLLWSHGVDSLVLTRVCAGTDALEVVAAWDRQDRILTPPGTRFSRSDSPSLRLVVATEPLISDDCMADERIEGPVRERFAHGGIRSLSLWPIVERGPIVDPEQGRFIGTLGVLRRSLHHHGPEELQLLEIVAGLTSSVITSIAGRVAGERQLRRWKAMRRVTEVFADMADEDALLSAAATLLVDEIGMVDAFIGIIDEAGTHLCEAAAAGTAVYPERPPLRFSLADRHIHLVDTVFTGVPAVIRNAQEQAEREGWGELARAAKLRNAVVARLRAGDTVYGAIGVGQALFDINEDDLLMITVFANLLATAISRLRADRERQRRVAELEAAHAQQARLLETVRELSTPVMPVHDGILVLPLVGAIDAARGQQITEALLHGIDEAGAKVVICDVTGVPTMDSAIADTLVKSMRAAALLGAATILVGISPTVAHTLVSLGVELGDITTCSNLQAGITRAMRMLGDGRG